MSGLICNILILGHKKNGFYIECGGADGEEGTNTLFFELNRNWKGTSAAVIRSIAILVNLRRNDSYTILI